MKPKVIADKCIGCGTCEALASNTFEMKGDKAIVKEKIGDDDDMIQMATDACPTEAIVIE